MFARVLNMALVFILDHSFTITRTCAYQRSKKWFFWKILRTYKMNDPLFMNITAQKARFPFSITIVNVNKYTVQRYLNIRLEIDVNS